jgi:RimJ/RimL family protein N-acetyltransferase
MVDPAVLASGWREGKATPDDNSKRCPSLPLQGERLRVRPLERQDLDQRQSWPPFNDPLCIIWDMPRYGKRENDRWFTRLTDGRYHLAYGVVNNNDLLVGMISLRDISWGYSARLGIAFRSTHVGKGYGTESLHLFLPYFFRTLDFRRMVLDVAAANLRAVRCYRKLGFRRVRSYWRVLTGTLERGLLDEPEYAPLRSLFRWRWRRAETLYYDMDLSREVWETML